MKHSITIPLVRTLMPNILAWQLVGTQPMTGPAGSLFNYRTKYERPKFMPDYMFSEWGRHMVEECGKIAIRVNIGENKQYRLGQSLYWCKVNFDYECFIVDCFGDFDNWYFDTPEQAMLFTLACL